MEITDVQIKALKYLIFKSKDCGPETKKICFALIDASEGLTKPVYFTANSKDAQDGPACMVSSVSSTHLQEVLKAAGSDTVLSHHGGFFVSPGIFKPELRNKEKHTHTIWLSFKRYDKKAFEVTKETVEKVELKNPLYDFDNH